MEHALVMANLKLKPSLFTPHHTSQVSFIFFGRQFMQRTQEKEEEDELEKERQQRIDESHWALDLPELQVKE